MKIQDLLDKVLINQRLVLIDDYSSAYDAAVTMLKNRCGALLVCDEIYNVDIFLGIGGGPEGVLSACALDAFNCQFQGRFLFKTNDDKKRAKEMGIKDLSKKYELNEIISGDSIFCATGITSGDLVSGIKFKGEEFISETLVTHKSSGLKKVIKLKQKIR